MWAGANLVRLEFRLVWATINFAPMSSGFGYYFTASSAQTEKKREQWKTGCRIESWWTVLKQRRFAWNNPSDFGTDRCHLSSWTIASGDLVDPNSVVQLHFYEAVHCLKSSCFLSMSLTDHFEPSSNHYLPRRIAYSEAVILWASAKNEYPRG